VLFFTFFKHELWEIGTVIKLLLKCRKKLNVKFVTKVLEETFRILKLKIAAM